MWIPQMNFSRQTTGTGDEFSGGTGAINEVMYAFVQWCYTCFCDDVSGQIKEINRTIQRRGGDHV